jgi:hypothetical protein
LVPGNDAPLAVLLYEPGDGLEQSLLVEQATNFVAWRPLVRTGLQAEMKELGSQESFASQ